MHNNKYDYNINSEYNISNISIINSNIYYTTNNYKYKVSFEFTPLIKKINSNNYLNEMVVFDDYVIYDSNKSYNNDIKIYAQLKLFYYESVKVLNVFGYYNPYSNYNDSLYCSKIIYNDNNEPTCTVTIEGQIIYNVKLIPAANFVTYSDIKHTKEIGINDSNPSLYWTTLDENNNLIYSDADTFENLDIQHNEYQKQNIEYINYLCKYLTGHKGKFKINVEDILNNTNGMYLELVVEITDKYGNITEYTNTNNIFDLTGDEQLVMAYIRFNTNLMNNRSYKYKIEINPVLLKDEEVLYNPNENIVDLYKQFFYKKYSISVSNSDESEKEIWDSYIQLDDHNSYDAYLMHGYTDSNATKISNKQSWYFMFISKNTCDDPYILNSLNTYPEIIQFNGYKLKHISTRQLFLINRMKVNYVDNVYHFNGNEMIVCSLYNNKMLPIDSNLISKWELKPISFGTKTNNVIYANTNTAIISINNSNTYDKGYYNLQVNYTLDSNIMNYQTINKKILIK